MKPPDHPIADWKSAVGGALCTIAVGFLCWGYNVDGGLALLSFDLPFVVRPEVTVDDTVIIYMDEPSANILHQPWTNNAAWSRDAHAQLVRRLVNSGARAIVFDVLFDRTTSEDADLVKAVGAARAAGIPVVVGADLDVREANGKATVGSPRLPFPELAKVADYGLVEWPDMASDKPRRHSSGFAGLPSMAERAARLTSPPLPDPLPPERWINFYGPAELLHRSFDAALDPGQVPHSFFTNKVCFIGALAHVPFPSGKPADEWHTPHTRWGYGKTPGVDISAAVYLNLVRNEWLTRLSRPAELLLVLVAGAGFGLLLTQWRPTIALAVGLGGFAATAAVSSWLMWQHHLWFSWLVLGTQIAVALVWSILVHTRRLTRENTALQRDLDQLTHATPASAATAAPPLLAKQPAPTPPFPPARGEAMTLAPLSPKGVETAPPAIPDHTLLQRIGKGAYGEVWLARNVIGSCHAVKIVRSRDFQDALPFEREFRGIQKFMPISRLHPGLVQILHAGRNEAGGFFYYIMEPADDATTGQQIDAATYSPKSLAQEIRRLGRIPVAECVRLGLRLTDALAFLHAQHLIHRDLKPSNIIFVRGEPKLADIGLVTDISTLTADASFVGTRGYIPPEGPGRPAADLFGLGRVLYEACMGLRCERFPQLPDTPLEDGENELLLELNQIILKACEEGLTQRYSSAGQMHAELLALHGRIHSVAADPAVVNELGQKGPSGNR